MVCYLVKGTATRTLSHPICKCTPSSEAAKAIEKASKEVVVDGQVTHVVVKGDTLYNICKRYNVTVDQLKVWNNLEDINIKLGQKLKVSE